LLTTLPRYTFLLLTALPRYTFVSLHTWASNKSQFPYVQYPRHYLNHCCSHKHFPVQFDRHSTATPLSSVAYITTTLAAINTRKHNMSLW
jgi:hypothetical protein